MQFFEILLRLFETPSGNELPDIGAVMQEVMRPEWEDLIEVNSSSDHLLWSLRGILYEYLDFPELIGEEEVLRKIAAEIAAFQRQPVFKTVTFSSEAVTLYPTLHPVDQRHGWLQIPVQPAQAAPPLVHA